MNTKTCVTCDHLHKTLDTYYCAKEHMLKLLDPDECDDWRRVTGEAS